MENSLVYLFQQAAKSQSEKLALVCDKKEFSYADLWQQVQTQARALVDLGLNKGDRVVICCGNNTSTVFAFWSVLVAGGVAVVISDEQSKAKVDYIIQDSGARFLFVEDKALGLYIEEGIDHEQLVAVFASNTLKNVTSLNTHGSALRYFEELQPGEEVDVALITEDLACLIYTSGSTGEPKGVTMSHGNMIAARDSLNEYLKNTAEDVFVSVLPLSFDYGLYQMIMSLSLGATLVQEKNLVWPLDYLKALVKYEGTVLPGVPVLFELMDKFAGLGKFDFSKVRCVTNTGAALTKKHIEIIQKILPDADIYSMYGLTECKRCSYLPPHLINEIPDSVGVAIPNTEIMIISDEGKVCAPGEIGQLVVRGSTVMQGYWNKPEKTAQRIKTHPVYGGRCLFTGDYGYKDERGYLYFKGRMDEVLKVRGRKLIPKEIETVLDGLAGVNEVAVICRQNDDHEVDIFAFVTLKDNKVTEQDIRAFGIQNLENFQQPHTYTILPAMPRNQNGKIDKVNLKAEYITDLAKVPETSEKEKA